jgi:hypothetical protein
VADRLGARLACEDADSAFTRAVHGLGCEHWSTDARAESHRSQGPGVWYCIVEIAYLPGR